MSEQTPEDLRTQALEIEARLMNFRTRSTDPNGFTPVLYDHIANLAVIVRKLSERLP